MALVGEASYPSGDNSLPPALVRTRRVGGIWGGAGSGPAWAACREEKANPQLSGPRMAERRRSDIQVTLENVDGIINSTATRRLQFQRDGIEWEVLKEGWLEKLGTHSLVSHFANRYFFLTPSDVIYFAQQPRSDFKLLPLPEKAIALRDVARVRVQRDASGSAHAAPLSSRESQTGNYIILECLEQDGNMREMILRAQSSLDAENWCELLKGAVHMLHQSMRRGTRGPSASISDLKLLMQPQSRDTSALDEVAEDRYKTAENCDACAKVCAGAGVACIVRAEHLCLHG